MRVPRAVRVPALVAAVLAGLPLGLLARMGWRDLAMRAWCRLGAWAVGLRVRKEGELHEGGSLLVANHVGYLDILALGCTAPGSFLAKAEISGWPLLGPLSRAGGTVFVERDRPRSSRTVVGEVARLLAADHRVILFAEAGVSTDGHSLGAFRPMLFEGSVASGRPVVPVALSYRCAGGERSWAWIEEPSLWLHLWRRVLGGPRPEVTVRFGQPLWPGAGSDRKSLAASTRDAVERLLQGGEPGASPPADAV